VWVEFNDAAGRPVSFLIKEKHRKPRRRYDMLAPLGNGIVTPKFLPFFYMYEFDFMGRSTTELEVKIDGAICRPKSIPFPVHGAFVYEGRYSLEPCIGVWNRTHEGPLTPLKPKAAGDFQVDRTDYQLVDNDGHYEIARIGTSDGRHKLGVAFTPPVPDVEALKDRAAVDGVFTAEREGGPPCFSGKYTVRRRGNQVEIVLDNTEGWRPRRPTLSFRLVFLFMRFFRTWPATYKWTATVDLSGNGPPAMRSGWTRKLP
ncbi:hypothetical protein ACFLU6_00995, partial [Acidobacteriota bacterium]